MSPTMTEGNLVRWIKKVGDRVTRGDILAEVETDKATMEVEAADEGVLAEILVAEGTNSIAINTPIATLDVADGKSTESADALSAIEHNPHHERSPPKRIEAPRQTSKSAPATAVARRLLESGNRISISPLARRTAARSKVEVAGLRGSGPQGRIVVADVIAAISRGSFEMQRGVATADDPRFSVVKPSNIRRAIAARLSDAKRNIPHFYLTVDCNVDSLLELRTRLNDLSGSKQKASITDFIIRASALALKITPEANACWSNGEIHRWNTVDIAVAVALEDGLIAPIVRAAEKRSVDQIAAEMARLASAAKQGLLKTEELQGGSFSISNLGMYGIRQFEAIVNPPHAAILAVAACERRPVIVDDRISIATMMTCTLSADHRILDGASGAVLLREFKTLIENPLALMR